jgi:hypothetical protein
VREHLSSELLIALMKATPEQHAAVEALLGVGSLPAAGTNSDTIQRVGRLAYLNGFADVWLGDEHFNLRSRAKARACLRYLVENRAFDPASARDLTNEIDPFVRVQCQLPPLPGYGEIKIHHYFNPSTSDVARLGREIIRAAGRNGRFYLNIA